MWGRDGHGAGDMQEARGEGERTTAKQGHDTGPPEVKGLSIPAAEGTLEGEDLKKHLE